MFKMVLEKAEEPEIKLPTSTGSLKKQKSSRKTSTSALLTKPKPLTVWITANYGKNLVEGLHSNLLGKLYLEKVEESKLKLPMSTGS